jgi:hypothetical protein
MRAPLAMNKKASIAVALALVGVFAATFSLLAATTITATFAQNPTMTTTSSNNATTKTTMANATETATLGKLILKENGHRILGRVIGVTNNSYTMESTYAGNGVYNGTTPVIDMITTTATINSTGHYSGKGQGLLRASDGTSIAAYAEKYTGAEDMKGNDNAQGTIHFTSLATGKLASLNNTDAVFKVQLDLTGSFTLQAWQQNMTK